MSPFRSGIGLLATHLNLPIIPMRIDGLFPFKIAKKHYVPSYAVQVRIGDPIRFEPTADPEEIAKELPEDCGETCSARKNETFTANQRGSSRIGRQNLSPLITRMTGRYGFSEWRRWIVLN